MNRKNVLIESTFSTLPPRNNPVKSKICLLLANYGPCRIFLCPIYPNGNNSSFHFASSTQYTWSMKKNITLLLLLALIGSLIVFGTACGGNVSNDAASAAEDAVKIPRTPEEVVRQYQAYVDSNQFQLAQSLSTPRSAPLHEMMATIVADTPTDSSLIHTQFISLNCDIIQQDTAVCNCLLRDEYEEYESEYILVKVEDRWLVDLPDEEGDFELFEQETLEEWPEEQ